MFRFSQKLGTLGVLSISKTSSVNRTQLIRTMHSLLKNKAYINGKWINAGDNKNFDVTNPANQKIVGTVPDMNVSDVQKAIDSAFDAFHSKQWQNTTAKERSNMLKVTFVFHLSRAEMTFFFSRNGSFYSKPTNRK